jgi:hypothetical protein
MVARTQPALDVSTRLPEPNRLIKLAARAVFISFRDTQAMTYSRVAGSGDPIIQQSIQGA